LVRGRNVIAAEVHQDSANSSDLGFDLELEGLGGLKEVSRTAAELDAAEESLGIPAELRSALWLSRAERSRGAGQLDREAEAIERAARLGPGNPSVDYQRAILHLERKEETPAYEAYLGAVRGAIGLKAGTRSSYGLFLPETLKAGVEPLVRESGV